MGYRVANPPPPEPAARAPEEQDLGVLRTTHRLSGVGGRVPLEGLLLASAVFAVGGLLIPSMGAGVLVVVAPFALLLFFVFSWTWLRTRGTVIALHAEGIVLTTRRQRVIIPFSEVDEIWYRMSERRVLGLRLVLHGGATHELPGNVNDPVDMANWVFRNCSAPLVPDALRALRDGETLRFGRVQVSEDAVETSSFRLEWKDVVRVRLQPGRVVMERARWFMRERVVPFEQVPHPLVFVAVVRACARRVEVDETTGT